MLGSRGPQSTSLPTFFFSLKKKRETKVISLGVEKAVLHKPHLVLGLGNGGSKRTTLLFSEELVSALRGPGKVVA